MEESEREEWASGKRETEMVIRGTVICKYNELFLMISMGEEGGGGER